MYTSTQCYLIYFTHNCIVLHGAERDLVLFLDVFLSSRLTNECCINSKTTGEEDTLVYRNKIRITFSTFDTPEFDIPIYLKFWKWYHQLPCHILLRFFFSRREILIQCCIQSRLGNAFVMGNIFPMSILILHQ